MLSSTRFVGLVALAFALSWPAAGISQTARQAIVSLPDEPQPQVGTTHLSASVENDFSSSSPASDAQTAPDQESTQIAVQKPAPQSDHPLTEEEKKKAAEEELQRELHQRMGGVVPNFNAVLNGSTVPLSPKQKMHAAFRSAIDPYQFGLAIVGSAIGQAEDSHHDYGQGMQGYGKRLGASYTDQFDGTILGNGVFPVLLKQDARYFRKGTGPFSKRLLYSVSTTVRCKGDNGKWQPNYSNLLGNLAAGGISNLYYPAADRGFALTIEQGFTVTAEGVIGALLIEFYPDIQTHFRRKSQPKP